MSDNIILVLQGNESVTGTDVSSDLLTKTDKCTASYVLLRKYACEAELRGTSKTYNLVNYCAGLKYLLFFI